MKLRLIVSLFMVNCLWVAKLQAELPQDTRQHMIYSIAALVTLTSFVGAGVGGYLLIEKTNTDKSINRLEETVNTMSQTVGDVNRNIGIVDADSKRFYKEHRDLAASVGGKFSKLSFEHDQINKTLHDLVGDQEILDDEGGDVTDGKLVGGSLQMPHQNEQVSNDGVIVSLIEKIDGIEGKLVGLEPKDKNYESRFQALDQQLTKERKILYELIKRVDANEYWIDAHHRSYNARPILGHHKSPRPMPYRKRKG